MKQQPFLSSDSLPHVIFIASEREVLRYFMECMQSGAEQAGVHYYVADMSRPETLKSPEFVSFLKQENRALVTFNQSTAMPTWERLGIPVYDFIQDHPRYFNDILSSGMRNLHPVVLDRNHAAFIRKHFPDTKPAVFLPNGGTTELLPGRDTILPYAERGIAVLYCGNCNDDRLPFREFSFLQHGSRALIDACIAMLQSDPAQTTEDAIERYLDDRENGLTKEDRRQTIFWLSRPVEESVRRHFKRSTMHALAKTGVQIEIYGEHWQDDPLSFPDNVHIHARVSSAECNRLAGNTKIALNYLPWFKDGCSERVFNNMLNGAVCVTDRSGYLEERFTDGKELVFFDLSRPEDLANRVTYLLEHREEAEQTAACGYEATARNDTWQHRMWQLLPFLS